MNLFVFTNAKVRVIFGSLISVNTMPKRSTTNDEKTASDLWDIAHNQPQAKEVDAKPPTIQKKGIFGKIRRPKSGTIFLS